MIFGFPLFILSLEPGLEGRLPGELKVEKTRFFMYTSCMKKIVVLTLIALLGAGGFAYASPICAMSMPIGIHTAMQCCQADNCCHLEKARPEITVAQSQVMRSDPMGTPVEHPVRTALDTRTPKQTFSNSASESPPEKKFYDLYSEYRI